MYTTVLLRGYNLCICWQIISEFPLFPFMSELMKEWSYYKYVFSVYTRMAFVKVISINLCGVMGNNWYS